MIILLIIITITLCLDNVWWISLGENCWWSLLEIKMLRYTVTVVTSMVKTDQTKRETRSIREVTTEGGKLLFTYKSAKWVR